MPLTLTVFLSPYIRDTNSHVTPESVLNPLSIFSLARKDLREKHTPEEEIPAPRMDRCNSIRSSTFEYPALGVPSTLLQPSAVTGLYQGLPSTSNELSTYGFNYQPSSETWNTPATQFDSAISGLDFMPHFEGAWQTMNTFQENMQAHGFLGLDDL